LKKRSAQGTRRQALGLLSGFALLLLMQGCSMAETQWTGVDLATLRSLWIGSLPALPTDPSNAVADDPAAAELGHALFFDTRLSLDESVSCASCHQPERLFTDGLPRAQGLGQTRRHAPSIVGSAYSSWFFWDGHKDSQWSQALGPLESAVEHGADRGFYAHVIDEHYRDDYEAIFGALPDLSDASRFPERAGPVEDEAAAAAWDAMAQVDRVAVDTVFANIGKAIAAYERRIQFGPSRFDAYAEAVIEGDNKAAAEHLSAQEEEGLLLFIGKAKCVQCHNGPRLTNDEFHNIGLPILRETFDDTGGARPASIEEMFDQGREAGVLEALDDPFNCLGDYSDAVEADCAELRFVKVSSDTLPGAFKVPSLRNVADTAPYMHDGRFETLLEALAHYNAAPPPVMGHSDLVPLQLEGDEILAIEAFLKTLSGGVDAEERWLVAPGG
jgi:cytochrome c peroxidase